MMNIVLLCQFGASTGMLADSIRESAEQRGMKVVVNAYSISEAKNVVKDADVVLLGPQLRFQKAKVESLIDSEDIPVMVVNTMDYGMMNGGAVLDALLKEIKGKEE